ncbi:MAG: hypothetical protein WEB60_11745, partial [Terrimicrobiaceae bacterium]
NPPQQQIRCTHVSGDVTKRLDPLTSRELRRELGLMERSDKARLDKALQELQVTPNIARRNSPEDKNDTWVLFREHRLAHVAPSGFPGRPARNFPGIHRWHPRPVPRKTDHPDGIVPVVGSANPENIRHAAKAVDINMGRETWYHIPLALTASVQRYEVLAWL